MNGTTGGSSPRAWGTRRLGHRHPRCARFIPTSVGNTRSSARARSGRPVHPHERGEHPVRRFSVSASSGSSPRAWGTRLRNARGRLARRFIPTSVGNTHAQPGRCQRPSVHPHERGEHFGLLLLALGLSGSSPRAWGTQLRIRQRLRTKRFIPTSVGNTRDANGRQRRVTVHPHERGEHELHGTVDELADGSSPRAWGTPRGCRGAAPHPRFIPTSVGNTGRRISGRSTTSVHPHERGEHGGRLSGILMARGSSPRAWGTQRSSSSGPSATRFIPTSVGNTNVRAASCSESAVHPHERGEHEGRLSGHPRPAGSSPRAWGTRRPTPPRLGSARFIPTSVGNTRLQAA